MADSNLSHKINLDRESETHGVERESLADSEKVIFDGIESPGRWS